MRELHLFAGVGGGILGGMLLGHTTVCAVEIEPYCRRVLLQRQRDGILPRFPIWDDVTTFDGKPWRGKVDIVAGGFPCQDISSAGKGKGIEGERSGLWSEMARIIGEIRPKYAFVENSPILTSRGLGVVLGDLASMGYDAQWGVISAGMCGAPHRRKRIWILAYTKCRFGKTQHEKRLLGKQNTEKKTNGFANGNLYQGWGCEFESRICRVAHGVDNRLDRLKAIGNGQVPIVAATAFNILKP
jgi:DNA (cytosine-5)-methyltransferase 1